MSKFIYEQMFDVKLYSELRVTDEYRNTHSGNGAIGECCGKPSVSCMESALCDPLVSCYIDPKEVACMRVICGEQYVYDTFNHTNALYVNFTLVDALVTTNVERIDGGYKVVSEFSVQTTSPTMLNEGDILERLPQVVRLFGNASVTMHDDYSKVDLDKVFKDTKAYCSLNYRTYEVIRGHECIELPDKLNVTILGCCGDDVFKVLTYYRDLYDACAKHISEDKYINFGYFEADDLMMSLFNYGIENYSWEDGYGDEPCDVTVGRNDNYSATDFFNKYLDTYDNLKCDDELVERVCDSDGEIRDNVFWTEELIDAVMKGFGFVKD